MTPEQFANQLGRLLPKELVCAVLYGSAAAGDFVPGASTYNLLLVFNKLTSDVLDAISPTMAAWCGGGNLWPLMFTTEQLTHSADAFPIELLDIRQSRQVLWGQDVMAELTVRPIELRLQVERELTGKLLALRGQYTLVAGRPDAVRKLMLESLSTFLVLFRAALRLHQDSVPDKKLDAMHALTKYISFDTRPFERLFELKQGATNPRQATADVPFADYLNSIECVINAVNHQVIRKGAPL